MREEMQAALAAPEGSKELRKLYRSDKKVFASVLAELLDERPDDPLLREWDERLRRRLFAPLQRQDGIDLAVVVLLGVLCGLAVWQWQKGMVAVLPEQPDALGGLVWRPSSYWDYLRPLIPATAYLFQMAWLRARTQPIAWLLAVAVPLFALSFYLAPGAQSSSASIYVAFADWPIWLLPVIAYAGGVWPDADQWRGYLRIQCRLVALLIVLVFLLQVLVLPFIVKLPPTQALHLFSNVFLSVGAYILSSVLLWAVVQRDLGTGSASVLAKYLAPIGLLGSTVFMVVALSQTIESIQGDMALGFSAFAEVFVLLIAYFCIFGRREGRKAGFVFWLVIFLFVVVTLATAYGYVVLGEFVPGMLGQPEKAIVPPLQALLLGCLLYLLWNALRLAQHRIDMVEMERAFARCLPVIFIFLSVVVLLTPWIPWPGE